MVSVCRPKPFWSMKSISFKEKSHHVHVHLVIFKISSKKSPKTQDKAQDYCNQEAVEWEQNAIKPGYLTPSPKRRKQFATNSRDGKKGAVDEMVDGLSFQVLPSKKTPS